MENTEKQKLAKLLRLLSSDIDGEVLGAVRAIERTLKKAGKSWHDLADTIVDKVIVFEIKSESTEINYKMNYIEAANWLLDKAKMEERERLFVDDMRVRFTYRKDFEPTPKQAGWFGAIVKKYALDSDIGKPQCKKTSGMEHPDPQTPPF